MAEDTIGAAPSLAKPVLGALASPVVLLGAAILVCALLLSLPLRLPLGPMYWDLVLYLDAANRIAGGQVPLVDFLAPVGPLGYWLYAGLDGWFPRSQPLLLAQWSLLAVTAPVMALVLREVDRGSRARALALLLPFLVFQLLPINVEQYTFFPGFDGFGIYNRQVSIVLYVLVAALVFLPSGPVLALAVAWTMLALLLLKITGFLAGLLIVGFAVLAGRLSRRYVLGGLGLSALALLALELGSGLLGSYMRSIADLAMMNAGTILPRFLQAGVLHLDIVVTGTALIVILVAWSRHELGAAAAALLGRPSWARLNGLIDHDAAWLAVVLAAGLFFETQNTGGQAFIFAWPVLLAILVHWLGSGRRGALLVCGLVAATAITPAEAVLHRAGRALLAQAVYQPLPHRNLGRLGQVSQHPDVIARAQAMQAIHAADPHSSRAIAAAGITPSASMYVDLEFQTGWLLSVDAGIGAIRDYEARTGQRFETIMTLNFANPFPALMARSGVRHLPIGADPSRSVPKPDSQAKAAIAAADLILASSCPATSANEILRALYAPAMAGRREIALGPCWTGYVRDEPTLRR